MFVKIITENGPVFHECENVMFQNNTSEKTKFGKTGHKFYSYKSHQHGSSRVVLTTSEDLIINIDYDDRIYLLNSQGNTIWTTCHNPDIPTKVNN